MDREPSASLRVYHKILILATKRSIQVLVLDRVYRADFARLKSNMKRGG